MAHKIVTTPEARAGAAAKIESTEAPRPAGASNQIQGASLAPHTLNEQERHLRISERAYQRASQRNFEPGAELEDWLAAEGEVDAQSAEVDNGGPSVPGVSGQFPPS